METRKPRKKKSSLTDFIITTFVNNEKIKPSAGIAQEGFRSYSNGAQIFRVHRIYGISARVFCDVRVIANMADDARIIVHRIFPQYRNSTAFYSPK